MRITKLELKNFKRFTDLRIENIPPQAKLVLLIGSNGSGKSSVFDAFQYLNSIKDGKYQNVQSSYFRKNIDVVTEALVLFDDGSKVGTNGKANFSTQSFHKSDSFYGRTSFRQLSRLTKTSLGNIGSIQSDLTVQIFLLIAIIVLKMILIMLQEIFSKKYFNFRTLHKLLEKNTSIQLTEHWKISLGMPMGRI